MSAAAFAAFTAEIEAVAALYESQSSRPTSRFRDILCEFDPRVAAEAALHEPSPGARRNFKECFGRAQAAGRALSAVVSRETWLQAWESAVLRHFGSRVQTTDVNQLSQIVGQARWAGVDMARIGRLTKARDIAAVYGETDIGRAALALAWILEAP